MKSMSRTKTDTVIEERLQHSLSDLARLVAQPSVSSQNAGVQECAELVAALLEEYGFSARILPTPSYPVVYAEARGRGNQTLLCYNHYDVQPAEPLDLWGSLPFELVEREGKLYGRGVADDKGHIISRLAALDALRRSHGELPCNVKFVIEGGEEISSPDILEFVEEHRDLLSADACVWEMGGVDYDGRPNLMLGMRGILYVQYTVQVMSRDAHSGAAHLLPNAAWRLLRALATIKDEQDRICIPGFYDDAQPLSEVDLQLLKELESHEQETKDSYGIDSFNRGLTGLEAKKAVFEPTANIAGIGAGYQGHGPKTVIPATATAKMDFRLVPDQDPADIFEKLQRHLKDQGFDDVQMELLGGEHAARTPPDDPFVATTAQTALEVYGQPVRVTPLVGGSGPIYAFRKYLGLPIVTVGVGYPETLAHAPNENIRIDDFVLGTRHMARLVERWTGIG